VLKFPNSDRQIQLDGAIMNLIALRSPGTVLCDVTQLIQPGVPLTTLTTRLNLLIRVFSY